MGQFVGIGQPVPNEPFYPSAELSDADKAWVWGIGQSTRIVARGLDIPMDELRLTKKEFGRSKQEQEQEQDMVLQPSELKVAKGTTARMRWSFTAFSDGKPLYVLINEQTTRLDIGDDWRVVIEESPRIQCEFGLQADPPDVAALNAARAVSFLPRIVTAPPA